jgi:hypothetical protein
MSLTKIHPRARRARHNSPPGENAREFAHFRLIEFAEANEEALLLKVFRAHSFPEEAFDGDRACRVVACYLGEGASFHEALLEACFQIDTPGAFFHWRRNDLPKYTPKLPAPRPERRERLKPEARARQ